MNRFKKRFFISLFCIFLLVVLVNLPAWCMDKKEEAEHGFNFWKEAWKWVNFIILVAVIYKLLATPLKEFLVTRVENIKMMLSNSSDALKTAENKLKEAEKIFDGLKEEIEELRKKSKKAMELEKERIGKETEEINKKINEQTKNNIEQLYRKSKKYISNELISEAIKISEELLRKEFTKDHQKILVEKYINSLEVLN